MNAPPELLDRSSTLLDASPSLSHALGVRTALRVGHQPILPTLVVPAGAWTPPDAAVLGPATFALAVVEGLLLSVGRERLVHGPGDHIAPWSADAVWAACTPVRLAVLGRAFTDALRPHATARRSLGVCRGAREHASPRLPGRPDAGAAVAPRPALGNARGGRDRAAAARRPADAGHALRRARGPRRGERWPPSPSPARCARTATAGGCSRSRAPTRPDPPRRAQRAHRRAVRRLADGLGGVRRDRAQPRRPSTIAMSGSHRHRADGRRPRTGTVSGAQARASCPGSPRAGGTSQRTVRRLQDGAAGGLGATELLEDPRCPKISLPSRSAAKRMRATDVLYLRPHGDLDMSTAPVLEQALRDGDRARSALDRRRPARA